MKVLLDKDNFRARLKLHAYIVVFLFFGMTLVVNNREFVHTVLLNQLVGSHAFTQFLFGAGVWVFYILSMLYLFELIFKGLTDYFFEREGDYSILVNEDKVKIIEPIGKSEGYLIDTSLITQVLYHKTKKNTDVKITYINRHKRNKGQPNELVHYVTVENKHTPKLVQAFQNVGIEPKEKEFAKLDYYLLGVYEKIREVDFLDEKSNA